MVFCRGNEGQKTLRDGSRQNAAATCASRSPFAILWLSLAWIAPKGLLKGGKTMKNLLAALILIIALPVACKSAGNDASLAIKYSLPQFGHYVTEQGAIREKLPADKCKAATYRLRSVEELIQEWFSSCLDKSGVQPVTKDAVSAWMKANYVPVEKKLQHVKEAGQIEHVASVVSYLAGEYQVYGLDMKKVKTCIGYINKLSKDSWALRIFGGKLTIDTYRVKARNSFNTGMAKVDAEIRRLMQPLEEIHRKEFMKWARANQQQFARLKKNDDDLEGNLILQAKLDEAKAKLDEATEAAERAEWIAAAAAAAAAAAEQRAR